MFIWISCFDKDNDIDKYKYLGYGIEFGSRGSFLFPGGNFTKTVIVFGVDMSSSVRPNNKTKNIIILCEVLQKDWMIHAYCREHIFNKSY